MTTLGVSGGTAIGKRIDARCSPLPVFDTAVLHAQAAVDRMLSA